MKTQILKALSSKMLVLGALAPAAALAQSGIRVGEPSYGGTGCPAGSASVTMTPDGTSLSILFDQYVVEAGGETRRTLDRKSCNVAIPVHVPQGYSVAVIGVDYRGYNFLPRGARSDFNVEYFFAGALGPRFARSFQGPIDSDYLISNTLIASAVTWSPCGQDVILRTNTSLRAQTNARREQTLATVDSQDVNAALIYSLQWQRCRL
jgi:hypothetical protein